MVWFGRKQIQFGPASARPPVRLPPSSINLKLGQKWRSLARPRKPDVDPFFPPPAGQHLAKASANQPSSAGCPNSARARLTEAGASGQLHNPGAFTSAETRASRGGGPICTYDCATPISHYRPHQGAQVLARIARWPGRRAAASDEPERWRAPTREWQ